MTDSNQSPSPKIDPSKEVRSLIQRAGPITFSQYMQALPLLFSGGILFLTGEQDQHPFWYVSDKPSGIWYSGSTAIGADVANPRTTIRFPGD